MGVFLCETVFVSLCVMHVLLLSNLSDSELWLGDQSKIDDFNSPFA